MIAITCIVIFYFIQTVGSFTCASTGYTHFKSENVHLCVLEYQTYLSQMESTCQNVRPAGVPFLRRMGDALYDEFKKEFEDLVKSAASMNEMFVGMKKDSGFGSSKWIYNNGDDSVEEDKFPFWKNKPQGDDCGVLKVEDGEYKVYPTSCSRSYIGLCEKKEKPCFHVQMIYAEYFGRCLSPSSNKAGYPSVNNLCYDGYVVPIKDEETMDTAAAALTSSFNALIYNGLKKSDGGKWLYESGEEEETDRFEAGNPGETNCGVMGVKRDGTATIFSADCEGKYRFVCEWIGT